MVTIKSWFGFDRNLCLSIVKMELYENGRQYNNKADLWEVIKTTMSETELVELKNQN